MAALVTPALAAQGEAAAAAPQAQPAATPTLPWGMDYQAALAQAKAEGKPILVDFTGSDWCGYCVQLSKVVFGNPEFVEYAKDKFVFLEVDLPNKPKFSREQMRANQDLADHFQVDGFPTILLLSPEGYPIGGFSGFAQLEQVKKHLETGRAALAKITAAAPESKLDVLVEIRKGLNPGIVSCAGDLDLAIMALDPQDKTGIARARKVKDELENVERQFNKSISDKGLDGLPDSVALAAQLMETVLPENRYHVVSMKSSAAYLLCTSKEDLQKWEQATLADMAKVAPAAHGTEQMESDKKRISTRVAEAEKSLESIKATRESINQRFQAVQAAKAEEAAAAAKEQPAEAPKPAAQPKPASVPAAAVNPAPAKPPVEDVDGKPVVTEKPVELHWLTDFATAQAQAVAQNRPILLEFTGSDWCVYCVKLHNDVFAKPEFAKYAKDKFVCMEVDLPEKPKFSQEQLEQNQELADTYSVDGFPTILVLNPRGEVVGGFGGYLTYENATARLNAALENMQALEAAASMSDADKLEVLVDIYSDMDESVALAADYLGDEIERLDTGDKYGLRYEKKIDEQSAELENAQTALMAEHGSAGMDKVLDLVKEWDSKVLPENRLQLVITKMGALLLKARTKADLEKLKETISADLLTLDPERADMESAQEVQDSLSNILDSADEVLESAKKSREELDKTKAAPKK